MAALSILFILSALVLGVLAVIGLLRGTAPFLKLGSRGLYGAPLGSAFVLLIVGGLLVPTSELTLNVTPNNATVRVDGKTYTGGRTTLKLVENGTYTVAASADGYKPQRLEWNTGKQRSLEVKLVKKTVAELAAEKAALERQKREQADALKQQRAAEAATRAAEARKARELSDGEFVVKCQELVKSRLKSPSTVRFPGVLEKAGAVRNYENGNKDWSGWVDSQNSFGAMLRIEFLCEYNLDDQKIELIVKN